MRVVNKKLNLLISAYVVWKKNIRSKSTITNYNCIYTFLMSLVSKMKFHPFFTLHSENSSNIPNNCHAK